MAAADALGRRRWGGERPGHEWPEFIAYRNLLHHAATFWHNALERDWEDVGAFLGDQLPKVLAHHVLPGADALAQTRRPCPGSGADRHGCPMPCKQVIVGSHDLPVQRGEQLAESAHLRQRGAGAHPARLAAGTVRWTGPCGPAGSVTPSLYGAASADRHAC